VLPGDGEWLVANGGTLKGGRRNFPCRHVCVGSPHDIKGRLGLLFTFQKKRRERASTGTGGLRFWGRKIRFKELEGVSALYLRREKKEGGKEKKHSLGTEG